MRKVLLVAILLCATSLSFVSCEGSDGNDEEQQQPTAESILKGRWKMTKVSDFPLPINNYYLNGDNYVTFSSENKLEHEGRFEVVINGDAARPMTIPFATYEKWHAENTSDTNGIIVYIGTNKDDLYLGYIMSPTRIDLVKMAEDKTHGISYTLEK